MHGYVLTDYPNDDYLYKFLREDSVDTLVIVPAWGVDINSRAKILCATKETFIRTSCGDPSRGIKHAYIVPEQLDDIKPYLDIKPHCHIILGNEPNLPNVDFFVYRYWLQDAITRFRRIYPYAKLISPAPIVATAYIDLAKRFYAVCQDALMRCDYSGIHAYAHVDFDDDGQLERAVKLSNQYLGNKPIALTEYGINIGITKDKLKKYKAMRYKYKFYAHCIFHISNGKEFKQYNVGMNDI